MLARTTLHRSARVRFLARRDVRWSTSGFDAVDRAGADELDELVTASSFPRNALDTAATMTRLPASVVKQEKPRSGVNDSLLALPWEIRCVLLSVAGAVHSWIDTRDGYHPVISRAMSGVPMPVARS
jgi:hypothetical protein